MRDIGALLGRLTAAGDRADRMTHLARFPAREAVPAAWPGWVDDGVRAALRARGIDQLWAHQVAAAELAWHGRHTVVATGTASGKSLGYLLPALSSIEAGRRDKGRRGASTLYLAPTKALAADQCAAIHSLGLAVRTTTHDGDSSREEREWAREHGEFVLTNPDMLHRSMLPAHYRWAAFFGSLRYVVVDEAHHYRGVFGAHVAAILRRLRRVAALYGADPTFVLASATMADPAASAERLTGLPTEAVVDDASPRGALSLALWEPPFTSYAGENGAPVRRAASSEAADLLADLVVESVRTLVFVRSRRGAEHIALTAAGHLADVDPSLAGQVASYRGGYLPEERRELEAALRGGSLTGLAATSALELGIDVAGLDAVVIAGFPGTRAAMWQQLGRAGREAQDALGVLIARDDPLDTYLVTHPEALLGRPVEATVFDQTNPYVLAPHLCAAAQEVPLTDADVDLFGDTTPALLDQLTAAGRLRKRPRGWFWTDQARAADLADIRSSGGGTIQLIEESTGRVVGTVDTGRAHSMAHAGAVYVHRGDTWLVSELDLDDHVATMSPADLDYSTSARETTEISIVEERRARSWSGCRLSLGEVAVTHQVVSFLRRRVPSGEVIGEEQLDLPSRSLRTTAVWWTVPDDILVEAGMSSTDLPGAAHAAEHCSIGLLPLFATCDRWDIGGVSTARHPDTGVLTVFVYDGYPGGAGFSERGFEQAQAWLTATRETIAACECVDGCPSCVQSPKCGNQNSPLDKGGAIILLDALLRSGASGG